MKSNTYSNQKERYCLYYLGHHTPEFLLHESIALKLNGEFDEVAIGIIMKSKKREGIQFESFSGGCAFVKCKKNCKWAQW